MQVIVTDEAKVFHVAGCSFIHNKDKIRTLTAGEAMREGYVPCLRCMRKYLQASAAQNGSGVEAETDSDADNKRGEGGQ
jgi:methylphosphotriester-DNA--protein-cysteine methyltransferase